MVPRRPFFLRTTTRAPLLASHGVQQRQHERLLGHLRRFGRVVDHDVEVDVALWPRERALQPSTRVQLEALR